MSYNGWITDRLPTEDDSVDDCVLTTNGYYVSIYIWSTIKEGEPWQPIHEPEPAFQPKRWSVDWNHYGNCYVITDGEQRIQLHFNQCKDAAQRICDIYNEVLP